MRIIEDLSAGPEFRVGEYPDPCLVEDPATSLRWLLNSAPVSRWNVNHAVERGASGFLRPSGSGWLVTSTETLVKMRDTNALVVDPPAVTFVERRSGEMVLPPLHEPHPSMASFVHLHAHSEYSPLDGVSSIQEMVDAAVADGQPAIAVTDHGYCSGHAELLNVSAKAGIKPLFGIEANLVNDRVARGETIKTGDYWHFIMLAATREGLRNIWGASTESHMTGFYGRARMDFDILDRHSEGVIATTACLRGPLADLILGGDESGAKAMLSRLTAIYGDRLYLELHTNDVWKEIVKGSGVKVPAQRMLNEALVSLGKEMGLPLILVADSHYSCVDHKPSHEIWIASQTDHTLVDGNADLFSDDSDYHISTAHEVATAVDYLPADIVKEAMDNTVAVAERCDVTIAAQSSTPTYHRTHSDPHERDTQVMREMCEAAWAEKVAGRPNEAEYRERYEYEVGLIASKQFSGYMLIVAEYCGWCRDKGILVGPGRGSSAGSLVTWLLGITGVDPIVSRLMFERFINPGRTSLPDIDMDFPTSKRGDVTEHIIDRWGADRVVRIGTHARHKNKGVINAVARVLRGTEDLEWEDGVAIKAIIDDAESNMAGLGVSWEVLWAQEGERLAPYAAKYPLLFQHAAVLVGRLKGYGRHPAGLVIAPDGSVLDWLPLYMANGQPVTQFPAEFVEFLGLVKFDILTVRTLDTIQEAMDLIRADPRLKDLCPDFTSWRYEDYDDPMVWDMLCAGDTKGIFQIETPGGTRLTRQFQPRSIEDLCAIGSLVRPGPMQAGITRSYLDRRFGREKVDIIHPDLERVLQHTYQLMIYQEDIMAVCQNLAGYTLEEADVMRSILGKKKVDKVDAEGKKFRAACDARGIDPQTSELLWEKMATFAKYAFNRSHSFAYAMMSYWCAWLKCHFPAHFYVALMSTADKKRIPDFVVDARGRGYAVRLPDVNESSDSFSVSPDGLSIRYGFSSIGGIGDAPARALVANRPWMSWDDFWERKPKEVNLGHVKTLVEIGAFDSILGPGQDRASLEVIVSRYRDGKSEVCHWKRDGLAGPNGLPCTFPWETEVTIGRSGKPLKRKPLPAKCTKACRQYDPASLVEWGQGVPMTSTEIRAREREVLGTWVSNNPFDRVSPTAWEPTVDHKGKAMRLFRGSEVIQVPPNKSCITLGLVTKVRTKKDRAGNMMAWVTVFAQDAEFEAVVFGSLWRNIAPEVYVDQFGVMGISSSDRGLQLTSLNPIPIMEDSDAPQ